MQPLGPKVTFFAAAKQLGVPDQLLFRWRVLMMLMMPSLLKE